MTTSLLTFSLDNALYAFKVSKIQEVLVYTQPVKVPCSSNYVEGIINSREIGISAVNLRKKFGLPDAQHTENSRIIVVEVNRPSIENPNHICTFGAICDSVFEVIEVENSEIDPTPKFGNNISAEYICGITKRNDEFIIILDEEKIFDADLQKK